MRSAAVDGDLGDAMAPPAPVSETRDAARAVAHGNRVRFVNSPGGLPASFQYKQVERIGAASEWRQCSQMRSAGGFQRFE